MAGSTKLYLIPTTLAPDTTTVLPVQIKEVVRELNYYLVEDVRTARRFLSQLGIGKSIEEISFQVLNKDTPKAQIKDLFDKIPTGENIGIMSEAGCPGIADPGALAVEFAHRNNIEVVPLVGPSSILLALMGSGMNGQSFTFHGYLPIDKAERVKAIKQLEKESREKRRTQIFMETPYRNNKLLEDIVGVCSGTTLFCIASDLTGKDQFIKTKTINEWKQGVPDIHKKPSIFLLLSS